MRRNIHLFNALFHISRRKYFKFESSSMKEMHASGELITALPTNRSVEMEVAVTTTLTVKTMQFAFATKAILGVTALLTLMNVYLAIAKTACFVQTAKAVIAVYVILALVARTALRISMNVPVVRAETMVHVWMRLMGTVVTVGTASMVATVKMTSIGAGAAHAQIMPVVRMASRHTTALAPRVILAGTVKLTLTNADRIHVYLEGPVSKDRTLLLLLSMEN